MKPALAEVRPARCGAGVPRGLTLVELLASLALLALISVASATLVRGVLRACAVEAERSRWERSAGAVLDSIGEDLAIGDFDPIGDRARGTPRVATEPSGPGSAPSSTLEIRTRSAESGPCVRRYWLVGDELLIETRPPGRMGPGGRAWSAPVALGDVTAFVASVDPSGRVLTVVLRGQRERFVSRCLVLPREVAP